jgi:phosphoserine phosphatase RsbU/P
MNILIAEDDLIPRRILAQTVTSWGYTPEITTTGREAWDRLQDANSPKLAILDWILPELSGVEICRRLRKLDRTSPAYIILLTGKRGTDAVVEGLESGANDFIEKPFDPDELRARLKVGSTVVELQEALADRISQLEEALNNIKQLQGLLPICCYCKKIRNDDNYWQQVEHYLAATAGLRFSHGICPGCLTGLQKQIHSSKV